MNAAQLPNLIPLLPEFVLGIGAMALLLLGVYRPAPATGRFIDSAHRNVWTNSRSRKPAGWP